MSPRSLEKRVRTFIRIARDEGARAALRESGRQVLARLGGAFTGDLVALGAANTALRERLEGVERALRSAAAEAAELRRRSLLLSRSVEFLAVEHGEIAASPKPDGPLVSVVLPTWDRKGVIGRAIASVLAQRYENWELLVVDDGSTDGTADEVARHLGDPRIRLLRQQHAGVSAARNRALAEARGEIVAYLDSDNVWLADHLSEVVAALAAEPERDCVYLAQLIEEPAERFSYVRFQPFDREKLRSENLIDLNVFAHRKSLVDRLGGFDESIDRLVDWELIARYTRHKGPIARPRIGGRYEAGRNDSVTARAPYWRNEYLVRRKLETPIDRPLRVLYALWHYPQLTESYVRWEIECMKRSGVEIELFSELEEAAAPFESQVRVHYGNVDDVIRRFRPHVMHVHWLNFVEKFRDAAAAAGIQITARGHGFEFTHELVESLQRDPVVSSIYLFPHFAARMESAKKIRPMCSAFNGDLYYPPKRKDRRLVVRVGTALPTKELPLFLRVAKACPDHRFVLALGRATGEEAFADEIVALNRSLGSPAEVRLNLQAEEIAPLVREAAITLHTNGPKEPYGMPMGISEAMAAGGYVIARRSAGSVDHVGDVGAFYETEDEAVAKIRETASWRDEKWRAVERAACERAYERHADVRVLRPLLDDWLELARRQVVYDIPDAPLDARFRPLIDYLMDQGMSRFHHHEESLIAHQINIGRGLLSWGCELDVCLAGIAHSLYGTERGGTGYDLGRRGELRKVIGERAERLVYWNCAMRRASFDEAVERGTAPYRFHSRFDGTEIELSRADFDDLCRIQLGDWLDQVSRCGQWGERRESYRRMAERLGGGPSEAFEKVYRVAPSLTVVPRELQAW